MGGLPITMPSSLQQSSSASGKSALSSDGAASGMFGGDWVVNLGGSGPSVQGGGASSLLLVAAAVVVACMLLRRKG